MAETGIDDGSGVLLRPARESDAERWLELLHDPDHVTYASPAFVVLPTGVEGIAEHIEKSRSTWEEHAPGTLVVTPSDDDGRFLGNISWRWTTGEKLGVAEIGYGIHPDARGRGVGRRAIVSLTRWLLSPDGRGLARVQLDHSVENEASCRVALAAGFEREGIRRAFLPLRDPAAPGGVRRHDVCLHGCTHVD
ncbi:GNAT family protein [Nocardioides sp.]|uniref:GNAT family N-acetyltransferase n=1 Tax=Nocardioides sp. TaxID=35761 RepID=UPI002ED6A52D